MIKPNKWKMTQWLIAVVSLGYFALLSLSPWYYSLSFTKEFKETEIKVEQESSPEREKVEPFYTDQYGNDYNAKGEQINEYGDILDGRGQWMPDPSIMGSNIEIDEEELDHAVGELPREPERALTMRESMILEREQNREPVEGEEDLQRNYKNQGKFNWVDYLFIIGVLTSLTYGYGLFLSNGMTLFKLLIMPTLILIGKTVYIIKGTEIYKLNITNVLNWWLGFVAIIVVLIINHINVMFICKEVGEE